MTTLLTEAVSMGCSNKSNSRRPRLGFLGVGWIGKNRMEAIAADAAAEVAAVADASPGIAAQAGQSFPQAAVSAGLDELLDMALDGIVIATPSALHCGQAIKALEKGLAVFCQKPLGRDAEETRRVVDAARAADRLLGVDLSYRFISGAQKVHQLCRSGGLGEIYAVDLTFHNGYGPDKAWFYDSKLSGGGCVIDLGIHLMDLALWNLGFPRVTNITSRLFAQGKTIPGRGDAVEDYALARLDLENGTVVNLTCSWKLPVGCDAIISAHFYGTKGGASFQNVNGSFYDFKAEHFRGTQREVLALPPEKWGGGAAIDWARHLAADRSFSSEIESVIEVADALDGIYDHSCQKQAGVLRGNLVCS
jgi:predicted dehydrogenase